MTRDPRYDILFEPVKLGPIGDAVPFRREVTALAPLPGFGFS